MENKQIIVVAGPTASGKSDFAVELALAHNGEIIGADSRQIYKGLDIGTGKITQGEMKGVKHHMLDVCDVNQEFSVAEYKALALPILEDIFSRGKTPIICGGTGQYIDALIFTGTLPEVPPNKKLREELEQKSTEELYETLTQKDPSRADTIDKHNRVRVIRALEIINSLGTVPTQEQSDFRFSTKLYLMNPSRELLRERITVRLEKRLQIGMIEEVQNLIEDGYEDGKVLKRFGIEYFVIGEYIKHKLSLEEMKTILINKSMQYAKRQQTWNKKYLAFAELVEVKK